MHAWLRKMVFSRVLRDSTPRYVGPSVGRSVGWSVGRLVSPLFTFWRFWAFWAHSSCPDDPVTFSNTAPAHPHATRVAVYPALILQNNGIKNFPFVLLVIYQGKIFSHTLG